MPIVSDYVVIEDETRRIGDSSTTAKRYRTWSFGTGGCESQRSAVLMLMVKGLTETSKGAEVSINGKAVGTIKASTGAHAQQWASQTLIIKPHVLKSGTNQLRIDGADNTGTRGGNLDDFKVANIVCMFQQSA